MASPSSSQAAALAPARSDHGIELTERKSPQYGAREVLGPDSHELDRSSEGSDDHEDATKSTNIDRHDMDRMGMIRARFCLVIVC